MQFTTRQSQSQNQKQGYYLSIQHMQFMHLLHLSGYALDEYLQNQLEENPLLELVEKDKEAINEMADEKEGETIYDEEFFQEEYATDQDKNYSSSQNDEDVYQAPVLQLETFTEQLKNQIDLMNADENKKIFAKYIIDELDDDGYLRRTNAEIAADYGFSYGKAVEELEVEEAVAIVQKCEPAGIGARNLQECLILQLKNKKTSPVIELTKTIIQDHYNKFVNHNFHEIVSSLNITHENFKEVLDIIHTLNPTPNTDKINMSFLKIKLHLHLK